MDLRLIRQHLKEAERHVALSDRHIARQIEIIDEISHVGGSVHLALDLLATYRALRASHVAHRDIIRKELER